MPLSLSEEQEGLSRFFKLNRQSTRPVDTEHKKDVSTGLEVINKQLEEFNNYIETDDRVLVAEAGNTLPNSCFDISLRRGSRVAMEPQ